MMGKLAKQIMAMIGFLLLTLLIGHGLNYVLVDDARSYTRIMMHQLQHPDDNIDVLFVGSSHVFRSLIPDITDKSFGAYTFNAGSSSQNMDGSLAVIEEAVRYNDIEQIYLEMHYWIAEGGPYKERTQNTPTYIISDYMTPSLDRLRFVLESSSKEHYSNGFLIFKRNWEKILDPDYVRDVITSKRTNEYRNYVWPKTAEDAEYYVDRGFVANDGVASETDYWNTGVAGPINTTYLKGESDYLDSLERIVALCEKEGIRLTLFVTPLPEWTSAGVGNWDEFSGLVEGIAAAHGIEFVDFNYCKDAYFDTSDHALFKDADHLNTTGAEAFSHLFGDFFTGRIDEEELFYGSLAEKMADQNPRVFGMTKLVQDGPRDTARIISNRESGLLYKITTIGEDGTETLLQDYDENKEISVPHDTHGTLRVEWKTPDGDATPDQVISATY